MVNLKSIFSLILLLVLGSCISDDEIKIRSNFESEKLNDDWEISKPNLEGLDNEKLQIALDSFFSEDFLQHSKALLIAKNGNLIVEAYAKDYDHRNQLHNIKSITKSITSIITGIALQKDLMDCDLDKTVFSYIPEYFDSDLEKRQITIKHCLMMRTGLEDPFYTVASVLPNNSIETSIGVNLVNTPGEQFSYNNGSANIIGGVINKIANTNFEKFTQDNLFSKLNITNYHWVKHDDGRVNPAFDLYLKPRDILKFGQFCLQNGNWNNHQLIPINWLQESTTNYGNYFGYHWWIIENHNGYYASGHGGQRLWVLPNKNTVILHLAEPSTDQTDLAEIEALLDLIIKAIN